MYFSLFLLLVLAVGLQEALVLKGADQSVFASVGEEVILNCSLDSQVSEEIEEVTWRKKDGDITVLLFQDNEVLQDVSDDSYKGRAEFLTTELSKGNFSLKLKDVRKEDNGEFICEVHTHSMAANTTVDLQTEEALVLKGADQSVFASVGEEVILNCSLDSQVSEEIEEVTWRKKDGDITVLLFQDNEVLQDVSDDSYKGRAEFLTTELSKGNFSLKLKDVRKEDNGEFICEVHTHSMSANTTVDLQTEEKSLVRGADKKIFSSGGGTVILNCSVDSDAAAQTIEEVSWRKKDGDILILVFQENKIISDASDERYSGRAEFFITEIPKGNFSLKLTDVEFEDEGEFICEVHTPTMSGQVTVILQHVGFSVLNIWIFVLCSVALLVSVGFCFPTFIMLRKKKESKDYSRKDLMTQAALLLCPNICMFVVFILWSKEGFHLEFIICSALSIARPIMLINTSPYLETLLDKLPALFSPCALCCRLGTGSLETLSRDQQLRRSRLKDVVKDGAVPLYNSIITIAVCSIFFHNTSVQLLDDFGKAVIIICLLGCVTGAVILAGFGYRRSSAYLLEPMNGFLFISLFFSAGIDSSFNINSILRLIIMKMMIVRFFQEIHSIFYYGFSDSFFDFSFLLMTLNLMLEISLYMFSAQTITEKIFLGLAVIVTVAWLAVSLVPVFTTAANYSQTLRINFISKVVALVLTIAYGGFSLVYTIKLMKSSKDLGGSLALIVLLQILSFTFAFRHPEHYHDLLHKGIYMFGAVGLTVISSITVAAELILKSVRGARTVEDLALVVVPFETVFISGWLLQQFYDFWMIYKDQIKELFKRQSESEAEDVPEMQRLSTPEQPPSS